MKIIRYFKESDDEASFLIKNNPVFREKGWTYIKILSISVFAMLICSDNGNEALVFCAIVLIASIHFMYKFNKIWKDTVKSLS